MLTTDELTAMRDVAGQALPDTAVIQAQTLTSDDGGAYTTTWSNAGTVDCRVAPIRVPDERETGGRVGPYADFVITLPFDAAVDTNSRILARGGTFNVVAVRERSWNLTTRVEAMKES